jgi:hypothetical protein
MKPSTLNPPVSRRQFLSGCAACAGAAVCASLPGALYAGAKKDKLKIRIVYSLHGEQQQQPDWPNVGFDFVPVMQQINAELTQRFKQFEFIPTLATGEEQAKKILEGDAAIDGYVVYQMNCWNRVVQTLATSGKPVLYADFQFGGSGGFLVYNARFLRDQAPNVGFVASSEMKDLVEAVKCFDVVRKGGTATDFVAATALARLKHTPKVGNLACLPDNLQCLPADECVRRLKGTRLLAVLNQEGKPSFETMGIQVDYIPFSEVNAAWSAADRDAAKAVADAWQTRAKVIRDVSRETLETSAAMYLGMKSVLQNHGASGITINCLGGFYGGHIHAYPCLGFYELNNEGLVGGCECDVRSASTMLAIGDLSGGRPGYISDPVIDTAKRQIIYAHCVAADKVFGPQGSTNPMEILTHSEDRQGAAVRSLMPVGYLTTSVKCDYDRREIILHQAKAVANDPDDRACRTKLCAEPVGDIEKLFREWDEWGWHRVTFYGDLKEPVYAFADAIGWKVVEEA